MSIFSWLFGPSSLIGKLSWCKETSPYRLHPTTRNSHNDRGRLSLVTTWCGSCQCNWLSCTMGWDTSSYWYQCERAIYFCDNQVPGGSTLVFGAPGYVSQNISFTIAASGPDVTLQPVSQRPAIIVQPVTAPPFDSNDPGGDVSTSLPPEQVIPPSPTIGWWRGDIGGVTLPDAPPMVPGGNSTPPTMTMSFLLPWYTQTQYGGTPQVDKILTAHAQRGYTHFHLDQTNWQAAGLSIPQAVDLFKYIQSWGFYTSYWGLGTSMGAAN